jgi:basic membrane protein A
MLDGATRFVGMERQQRIFWISIRKTICRKEVKSENPLTMAILRVACIRKAIADIRRRGFVFGKGGQDMKKNTLFTMLLVMLLVAGPLFAGGQADAGPATSGAMRVAMVLSGPINDSGWNESAYKGLMKAKEMYGIAASYSESVAQPDFETVIRDYAESSDLVICHGFQFSDAVKRVAPLYPKVKFAVVNGDSFIDPNMSSFRFNTPETGFIAGVAAGMVTKANVIGMIGGNRFPHIEDSLVAFEAGAKMVNPLVKVLTGYVDSFSDVPKGYEMAQSMIDQGADVLSSNADAVNLGVLEASKSRGIRYIGYVGDMYALAPQTVVVSAIQSVDDMMGIIIKLAIENRLTPKLHLVGAVENVIRLSPLYENEKLFPAGGVDKLLQVEKQIKDGTLKQQGILIKSVFERNQ